jgi:hypothetical protein
MNTEPHIVCGSVKSIDHFESYTPLTTIYRRQIDEPPHRRTGMIAEPAHECDQRRGVDLQSDFAIGVFAGFEIHFDIEVGQNFAHCVRVETGHLRSVLYREEIRESTMARRTGRHARRTRHLKGPLRAGFETQATADTGTSIEVEAGHAKFDPRTFARHDEAATRTDLHTAITANTAMLAGLGPHELREERIIRTARHIRILESTSEERPPQSPEPMRKRSWHSKEVSTGTLHDDE